MRCPLGRQNRIAVSIAIGLSLLAALAHVSRGADAMSAADARRELLERDFTIVRKTKDVPEPVRVLLEALTKTDGKVLAEPGDRYQETDVIAEPGLPRRRLIFAGNGKGVYFVNYELGGRGHSQHVAVFEFRPGEISLVWRAVLDKRVDTLKDLREEVRNGRYKDGSTYGF
jgi:hypothetical protein